MIGQLIVRNYIRKPLNIEERYGKGTWALVTGATGGIGEAYCIELAKNNFNVILQGRNKDKLEESEKRVKLVNNKIKTKILVADLGESLAVDFYQALYDQIKDLDISILVNNAGWGEISFFELESLESHIANFRVNSAAPTMLTHFLINQMRARNNKSAIVNVSTCGNNAPLPYMGVYCASKRFLTLFSYYLTDNYGDKIDVQDLTPAYVTTKMVNNHKGYDSITAEKCAQCSIRDLGQEFHGLPVPAHSLYSQSFHTYYRHLKPLYKALVVSFMEKLALRKFFAKTRKAE